MKQNNYDTYNLFLDDVRQPSDCFSYMRDPRYNIEEWVVVRDYEGFVATLELKFLNYQFPKLIALDHDLGQEHVNDLFSDENWGKRDKEIVLNYETYKEKTGLHVAQHLVDFCIDKDLILPEFLVHSMNPVGKQNIFSLLNNFRKHQIREGVKETE